MNDPLADRPTEAVGPEAPAAFSAVREGTAIDAIVTASPTSPAALRGAAPTRGDRSSVRRGASGVAARLPAALAATRVGARWTIRALQSLPDSTLRSLAATSVGLGAGLSFTRAGRLAAVAGMLPALVMGTAIAVRPTVPVKPEGALG